MHVNRQRKRRRFRKLRQDDAVALIRSAIGEPMPMVEPASIPRIIAIDKRRCFNIFLLNARNAHDTPKLMRFVETFCHRDCFFQGPNGMVVQGTANVQRAMVMICNAEPPDIIFIPRTSNLLQHVDGTAHATLTVEATGTIIIPPNGVEHFPGGVPNPIDLRQKYASDAAEVERQYRESLRIDYLANRLMHTPIGDSSIAMNESSVSSSVEESTSQPSDPGNAESNISSSSSSTIVSMQRSIQSIWIDQSRFIEERLDGRNDPLQPSVPPPQVNTTTPVRDTCSNNTETAHLIGASAIVCPTFGIDMATTAAAFDDRKGEAVALHGLQKPVQIKVYFPARIVIEIDQYSRIVAMKVSGPTM